MLTIKVQIKSVYGVDTVYPACPKAMAFAAIAKTKTLTNDTLEQIERLGIVIVVEQPTITRSWSARRAA
jgi:hypothetical protein